MGSNEFVSKVQSKIEKVQDDWSIPKKQKRAFVKSISEIENQTVDRNSAIITAYARVHIVNGKLVIIFIYIQAR